MNDIADNFRDCDVLDVIPPSVKVLVHGFLETRIIVRIYMYQYDDISDTLFNQINMAVIIITVTHVEPDEC